MDTGTRKESDFVTVKELHKGDFFTKKPIEAPTERQVWIRGEYDRTQKKYECVRFDDISTCCYLKSGTEVYTDFSF